VSPKVLHFLFNKLWRQFPFCQSLYDWSEAATVCAPSFRPIGRLPRVGKRENILFSNLDEGAFTLANFARNFALSLHILLNKNYLFSLLNVQASAKSRAFVPV